MPRYLEEFEVVRQDSYNDALELLAEAERRSGMDGVSFIPADRNRAVARGGVAQKLFEAGVTDADLKALIGPWVSTWMGAQAAEARRLLNIKPQEAAQRNTIRDSQQAKVYAAEGRIPEGALLTTREIEEYVAQVCADPWFKQHHPEINVHDIRFEFPKKGNRATCKTTGSVHKLRFPPRLRNKKTVLHELAHACANAKWGRNRIAGHGAEFVYCYLRLVYRRFGKEIGFALLSAFNSGKVSMAPRQKPLALLPRDDPAWKQPA
jgi:hypothetical protein